MRTRIRRPRRFGLVPRKPTVKLATQDEARLAMALCQDKDGQVAELRGIWELEDPRKTHTPMLDWERVPELEVMLEGVQEKAE
jgi:hypothetical protein